MGIHFPSYTAGVAALLAASVLSAAPGLDTRPGNSTCLAPVRAPGAGTVSASWLTQDIGNVAAAGYFRPFAIYLVGGSGADIWGTADEFRFGHRLLTGDGDIVARLRSFAETDPWAKAGLMIRESLQPNARFAMVLMTPGQNGGSFQYRSSTGGSAGPNNSADKTSTLPRWLKLSRRGNVISGYLSADGSQWTLRGNVTLSLPGTVYAGLAVTSHKDGSVSEATFDSVSISTGTGSPSAATYGVEMPFPSAPAFTQPTKLLQAPGDAARWFVLEKTGRVKVFRADAPGTVSTWLNLSTKVNTTSEGGLLGLAFHPLYPQRKTVFVAYTTGDPMQLVISRFNLDNVTQPATVTEQPLITINKAYGNHNGGDIAFGPDGHLYIAVGDGGGSGDPGNYGQNLTRLLGKFLRIDAWDVGSWPNPRYAIPADNPYAGNTRCGADGNAAPCPEIFAWGFRNPWRFSFDASTAALWVGDVGQSNREEIDVVVRGGNYGWRCREGTANYQTSGCATSGFRTPVHEYGHSNGNAAVTGGFVYRGSLMPSLYGQYVFGDYVSGRIWALKDDGLGGYQSQQLVDTASGISSFGVGLDGELYFTDYGTGRIYRLHGTGTAYADVVPDDLAATGCVNPGNPAAPAAGVIPFGVNAPFWSDGAEKERFFAVPNGTSISIQSDGDWQMPAGSVLMKTMRLAGAPVETRLLMRHPDGGWAGYTYEWDSTGSRALRVRGGKRKFLSGQDWIYPSEGECLQCHTGAAGMSLGPETGQMNRTQHYPATGRVAQQLETLSHVGLVAPPITSASSADFLPPPTDGRFGLDDRARAYLHSNCAGCHRPGGPTGMSLDLRYRRPLLLADTGACNAPPEGGNLGIANAKVIAPGDPSRSILLQRILRRDSHGMPPLASSVADPAGAALLSDWIRNLPGCDQSGNCHANETL